MTIVNAYFLVQGARLGKALPAGLAKAVRLFAARLHEADVLCLRGHTPGLGLTADHKSAILYWAEVYDIHQFSIRVHVGTPTFSVLVEGKKRTSTFANLVAVLRGLGTVMARIFSPGMEEDEEDGGEEEPSLDNVD